MNVPYEYFCNDCEQLRLCLDAKLGDKCGNCGSTDIIKGAIESLDKEALIRNKIEADMDQCSCGKFKYKSDSCCTVCEDTAMDRMENQ